MSERGYGRALLEAAEREARRREGQLVDRQLIEDLADGLL